MQVINLAQDATPFGPFDREKDRQLAALNCLLFDLTVDNGTGGTDCFVQLWDVADAADIGGANADSSPDFETLVPAGLYIPFAFNGGYQFHRGLYVRCVTASGGATLISGDDVRYSGRFLSPFPLSV